MQNVAMKKRLAALAIASVAAFVVGGAMLFGMCKLA